MLKLKRFDEAAWYDYEPGVRLKIKPISKVDSLQIRVRCKRKIIVQGLNGNETIVDDLDMKLLVFESFRMALRDWEGITIGGVEKPTREEMIDALFENERIVDFVLDRTFKANEKEEAALENESKNSESSQPGS